MFGLTTTGWLLFPTKQLLPSSGLISLNLIRWVHVVSPKFVSCPAVWASANTSRNFPPKFIAFVQRAWTFGSVVVEQPSAVVRLSGIRSGLVTSIADRPAGGGRIPPANCPIPPVQPPPSEALGGSQPPDCTVTGRPNGV